MLVLRPVSPLPRKAVGFLCGVFNRAHLTLGTGCALYMGQALCLGWCGQLWGVQAVSGTPPTPGAAPQPPVVFLPAVTLGSHLLHTLLHLRAWSCCHRGLEPAQGTWGPLGLFLGLINTQSSLTQLLQCLSCCPWDGITLPLLQGGVLGCSLPALLAKVVMKY